MPGEDVRFDVAVPLEIPPEAKFTGPSGRRGVSHNNEVAFHLGPYPASAHETPDGSRYFLVRTSCLEPDFPEIVAEVAHLIRQASVNLDISMRLKDVSEINVELDRIDLNRVTFFRAGSVPNAYRHSGSFSIQLSAEHLSDATRQPIRASGDAIEKAIDVFCDVDFEASTVSRFALLTTVLEILASRGPRDSAAVEVVERWEAEAKEMGRVDLQQAASNLKSESIATAIARLVGDSAASAGLSDQDRDSMVRAARTSYRKRSKLLHAGSVVTSDDLSEIRGIVRFLLTAKSKGTPFSPIATLRWADD